MDSIDIQDDYIRSHSDKESDLSSTTTDEIEKTKELFGEKSIITKSLIKYREMKRAGKFKRRKL